MEINEENYKPFANRTKVMKLWIITLQFWIITKQTNKIIN